ncbi:MAG: hypothetical protein LBG76_09450 [Treponema sp.]|jgi:hypothetical protein|nr:hypothetical protein [Treponema sp.]
MDASPNEGLLLTLSDLRALFPRLKRMEAVLAPGEWMAFSKIEKYIYEYHSVEELETLIKPLSETGGGTNR